MISNGTNTCNVAKPAPVKLNPVEEEVVSLHGRAQLLALFEAKHHDFLSGDVDFFVNETDGAITFFSSCRQALRDHFGQGWVLRNGAVEKVVDGVTLRLLPENDQRISEEIEL